MDFTNVQWLDIANRSLAMISSNMLTKMDEGTTESNFVTVLLPGAIEEVYASLPLDDISIYEPLPRLSDISTEGIGFKYAYKLPDSLASIRDVLLSDGSERWQLVRDAIYSDSPTLTIRYVALPSIPNEMPYYARNLVGVLLASRLAGPVAHNESLANLYRNQYESLLARALTLSGKTRNQESWARNEYWSEVRE